MMKPIAIFRHSATEGPAYFATYLDRHRLPWRVIKLDEGEAVPADPGEFSGLCFMGGPMSVNDVLPWIAPVLQLIRDAAQREIAVLGHCLGGQLMARALGGVVTRNPVKEIGWGEVLVVESQAASDWFDAGTTSFEVFHWHGETFSVPPGSVRVLASRYCENQGFILGKHLGLQCHIEMNEQLVKLWCDSGAREIASSPGPGVQSPDEIQRDLGARVAALHRVADRVYDRWICGLDR
jgi:GMP synthase-like glutamine amidotransferase